MKKKLVVFSLVLALAAIAVGGTLAYFMDEDEVTNTFTIGSVEIEQIEEQRKLDAEGKYTSELEAFVNDKQLIPVISDANAKNDVNFQDKIVTVKNLGKNDAYVQVFVAVPRVLADAKVLFVQAGNQNDWEPPVDMGIVAENAIVEGSTSAAEYRIYKYVYTKPLLAKADGATVYPVTTPAIDGVYISQYADMDVTYKADGSIEKAEFVMNGTTVTGFDATQKINVYVATQAIQARGFADANTALANFGTHPWVTTP
jgi:predicted ribosomally synthesized peptide with SipW-like signal peptide